MPSSTERIAGPDREKPSPRRLPSMEAMGASRLGGACAVWPGPWRRNSSSQSASRRMVSTWRKVQTMPSSSTPRITPFSTGLAMKATRSCAESRAAMASTTARKTTIRSR